MLAAFKTPGSDDDDELLGEDEELSSYEEEESESEAYEDEHDAFGGYTKVSSFAYTLPLVVGKFSQVRSCSATINKANGSVKKVNKSTELLIQHCGKKLVKDCLTCLSYTFLLMN